MFFDSVTCAVLVRGLMNTSCSCQNAVCDKRCHRDASTRLIRRCIRDFPILISLTLIFVSVYTKEKVNIVELVPPRKRGGFGLPPERSGDGVISFTQALPISDKLRLVSASTVAAIVGALLSYLLVRYSSMANESALK